MNPSENSEPQEKLGAWAIVELFGHTRIAGFVSEFQVGGSSFVRVDVPEVQNVPPFTRLYGPSAIYSISFVGEDLARQAVQAIQPRPITIYIPTGLPAPQQSRLRFGDPDFHDDEDDEDEDDER